MHQLPPSCRTDRVRAAGHRGRPEKLCFARPDMLVLSALVGILHTTNDLRRQFRDVMDQAGTSDVTSHGFRCSSATAVNEITGL